MSFWKSQSTVNKISHSIHSQMAKKKKKKKTCMRDCATSKSFKSILWKSLMKLWLEIRFVCFKNKMFWIELRSFHLRVCFFFFFKTDLKVKCLSGKVYICEILALPLSLWTLPTVETTILLCLKTSGACIPRAGLSSHLLSSSGAQSQLHRSSLKPTKHRP